MLNVTKWKIVWVFWKIDTRDGFKQCSILSSEDIYYIIEDICIK